MPFTEYTYGLQQTTDGTLTSVQDLNLILDHIGWVSGEKCPMKTTFIYPRELRPVVVTGSDANGLIYTDSSTVINNELQELTVNNMDTIQHKTV